MIEEELPTYNLNLLTLTAVYQALRHCNWSLSAAAKELGIARQTALKFKKKLYDLGWPIKEWSAEGREPPRKKKYKSKASKDIEI